jgi:hypothetical protein
MTTTGPFFAACATTSVLRGALARAGPACKPLPQPLLQSLDRMSRKRTIEYVLQAICLTSTKPAMLAGLQGHLHGCVTPEDESNCKAAQQAPTVSRTVRITLSQGLLESESH